MPSDLERRVGVRFPVEGPIGADRLAEGFAALDRCYTTLFLHARLQERAITLARSPRVGELRDVPRRWRAFDPPWYADWPWAGALLEPPDRLVVTRLEFASPGFGDLQGAAGPLETLRKYRVDRNERRKDREWREDLDREQQEAEVELKRREAETLRAEARKLEAEAERVQFDTFKDRYEMLKELVGVDEARRLAAQQLTSSNPAIDLLAGESGEQPTLLEPSSDPPTG